MYMTFWICHHKTHIRKLRSIILRAIRIDHSLFQINPFQKISFFQKILIVQSFLFCLIVLCKSYPFELHRITFIQFYRIWCKSTAVGSCLERSWPDVWMFLFELTYFTRFGRGRLWRAHLKNSWTVFDFIYRNGLFFPRLHCRNPFLWALTVLLA